MTKTFYCPFNSVWAKWTLPTLARGGGGVFVVYISLLWRNSTHELNVYSRGLEALENGIRDVIKISLKGGDAKRSKTKQKAQPKIWYS